MRLIGSLPSEQQAERFSAYLLTLGTTTHLESTSNDGWQVWVREEDRRQQARQELEAFLTDPESSKYAAAVKQAEQLQRQERQRLRDLQKSSESARKVMQRRPGSVTRTGPITLGLLISCVALALITNFDRVDPDRQPLGWLIASQMKFVDLGLYRDTGDPAASLKRGQVWRLLTPALLHGSLLHLVFNMFWLFQFGRVLEALEGPWKYLRLILLTALGSALLQGLMPPQLYGNPNFVGFSGVVFGLVTYLWVLSQLRPQTGIMLPPSLMVILLVILLIGFLPIPGMRLAGLAHLGGMLAGAGFAWWLNR
jgi:GlpG protein